MRRLTVNLVLAQNHSWLLHVIIETLFQLQSEINVKEWNYILKPSRVAGDHKWTVIVFYR